MRHKQEITTFLHNIEERVCSPEECLVRVTSQLKDLKVGMTCPAAPEKPTNEAQRRSNEVMDQQALWLRDARMILVSSTVLF